MDDTEILDGEGSYMELVSGTVTDVTPESDTGYILILQLDDFSASYFGEPVLQFRMEYDHDTPKATAYKKGDNIWVNFPGGMHLEDESKLVTIVSDSGYSD